ncbi:MAG: hypothetical protein K0S26_1395 [Bacteroidota bacterium]|nr:hypothetical protein [Bacteroidota bacterium]
MEKQHTILLEILAECAAECNKCAMACLEEPHVKMMTNCIKLDIDCAQFSSVTAAFVARNSDHAIHLLNECSEICTKCAEECGKHQEDHCQRCAAMCRKCAAACRQ